MNKHFDDSRYYLSRAAEHARLGLTESLEPLADRVRTYLGRDPEPEPESGRFDGVREDVTALETRATARARGALGSVRDRVTARRSLEAAADR
ncbi:DUF7553 family protein [Natrinema sp. LN54]|uniref:DUF7553 family protein n=1 Tax=Natrinema sp. LN54 TaxID=3458705 RepID=UPI00403649E0